MAQDTGDKIIMWAAGLQFLEVETILFEAETSERIKTSDICSLSIFVHPETTILPDIIYDSRVYLSRDPGVRFPGRPHSCTRSLARSHFRGTFTNIQNIPINYNYIQLISQNFHRIKCK